MKLMLTFLFAAVLLIIFQGVLAAATIYVDWRNTSPTTNGTSWATAWTTIGQGRVDLLASNTAVKGGHTVLIATGEYVVANADITLSESYSGTNGAPNTIKAVGDVGIDGVDSGWALSGASDANSVSNIILDGFHCHDSNWGIGVYYAISNIVRNCRITRTSMAYSGMSIGYHSQVTLENCSIYGNGLGIYFDRSRTNTIIKNCIIAGNAIGLYRYLDEAAPNSGTANLTYSCLYGNGVNYRDRTVNANYNSEAEINAVSNWSANIVRNPGFADLATNWNFGALYDNSPCLNAGAGGVTMGAYTNPTLVASSSNTYYVGSAGNDGYTKEQATNSATPWKTLTNAAANAVAGDTVIVLPATYTDSVRITKGGSHNKPLTFRVSAAGTVTNQSAGTYAFQLDRVSGVTLDGFKIVMAGQKGVILTNCAGNTLTNMEIVGNGSSSGLWGFRAHANTIANCSIHDWSEAGYLTSCAGNIFNDTRSFKSNYGMYFYTYGCYFNTFLRCLLYQDSGAQGYGSAADACYPGVYSDNMSSITFNNCNIYDNKKGVYCSLSVVAFINSDIVSNSEAGVYHSYNSGYKSLVTNCIIAQNGFGIREGGTGNNPVYSSYNCFYNNQTNYFQSNTVPWSSQAQLNAIVGCSNNIVADPQFVYAPTNNYRLNAGSPCLGAGRPVDLTGDLYGNPRPRHALWDIGSFQWWPPNGTVFLFY